MVTKVIIERTECLHIYFFLPSPLNFTFRVNARNDTNLPKYTRQMAAYV